MLSLLVVFVVTLVFFQWFLSKPRNFPPGPLSIPVVGSTPFIQLNNFHFYLENIKQQYGPVVGFKFGPKYVVTVSGAKEVREVLSRDEFQGRHPFARLTPGIMFSEGQFWAHQRRFTIRHLRDFGFGKKSVETVTLQEAQDFFTNVLRQKDVVQVSGLFTVSSINVLWMMMGGQRYSHHDEEFKELLDCLQKRFRSGTVTGGVSNMFPLLRKLFPNLRCFKEEIELENRLNGFLQRAIDAHKETRTDEPRDFMDVYLRELEKPNLHSSFSEETLRSICTDLFSAGSESVGNSLGFCLLYCVLYPKWQEELYREIEEFGNGTPYLEGKDRLPKVEAFLTEVNRCNTIATLAVPHKTVEDTALNGYFIPKDTMVFVSLWSVLQDKDHWKDPEHFRPERFLDESGNYKKDNEWLPVFGLGKRICPGETLAKSIIFVYFIALIREFKFSIPEGHPKPSTVCLSGFTNAPRAFEVKISRRQ